MKTRILALSIVLLPLAPPSPEPPTSQAPSFGSDGSDGVFHPTSDVEIDLSLATSGTWSDVSSDPGTGFGGPGVYDANEWAVVFKYSSVTIPAGVKVTFENHPSHAPVVWLVQGAVTIGGELNLRGENAQLAAPVEGAFSEPGPGGFRGGRISPEDPDNRTGGFGPGGGFIVDASGSGGGYAQLSGRLPMPSPVYGSVACLPLIGGSGGSAGGVTSIDARGRGGGGGGAILIACDASIALAAGGSITARGGNGNTQFFGGAGEDYRSGAGSGGAIRLVADSLQIAGGASLDARGGAAFEQFCGVPLTCNGHIGSVGRIRLEFNSAVLSGLVTPPASESTSLGPVMGATARPSIRVTQAGGMSVPVDPSSTLNAASADVELAQPGLTTLLIETQNVDPAATIEVRITPKTGNALLLPAVGDPPITLSGSFAAASATVQVDLQRGVSAIQARAILP